MKYLPKFKWDHLTGGSALLLPAPHAALASGAFVGEQQRHAVGAQCCSAAVAVPGCPSCQHTPPKLSSWSAPQLCFASEEINYQKAVREQRLAAEISAAKRERDFYLRCACGACDVCLGLCLGLCRCLPAPGLLTPSS